MRNKNSISIVIFLLFIIVILSGCNNNQSNDPIKKEKANWGPPTAAFSEKQLQLANDAISKGIKINDSENDFVQYQPNTFEPDGRLDNPKPYPLPYTDLKSVSVGADKDYLYVKFEFWGIIPSKISSYDNDTITSTNTNIQYFYPNGKDQIAEVIYDIMYNKWVNEKNAYEISIPPSISQMSMITPIGEDARHETKYANYTGKGMIYGGGGYEYILSATPLNVLGFKYGDEILFSSGTETGSSKYHHEVVDPVHGALGQKEGDRIKYTIGSNTYEIITNENMFIDKSVDNKKVEPVLNKSNIISSD